MAAFVNEKRQAAIVANESLRDLESERDKLRSAHRELLLAQADGSLAPEQAPILAAHEKTARALDQRIQGARRLASEAEKELADALAEADRLKANAVGADGSRIHGRPPRPAGFFAGPADGNGWQRAAEHAEPVSARANQIAARLFPTAQGNRAAALQELELTVQAALGSPAGLIQARQDLMFASAGPGTTTSNPDGGWMVSAEVGRSIFSRAFEQSVAFRCGVPIYPMKSGELTVTALADHDASSGAVAGLLAAWSPEASTATAQALQLRRLHLVARKLLILASFSSELSEDAPGYAEQVERAIAAAIAARLDAAFLSGTGVGMPQGLTVSPCAITVSKEAGQAADSLVWRNVAKVLSRMHTAGIDRCCWLASPTTLPSLLELNVAIGTGGAPVGEAGFKGDATSGYHLAGRPLYFTARLPVLGDVGDLVLFDPLSHAMGIRSGLSIEASPAPYFDQDVLAVRGRMRADAQSFWDVPVTCEDGITRGPIVLLEART
jgi:HK97 family phage major capsid protein